ncbi:MAG: bacteriocin [Salinivirgaceae bacterium]|nr:bacteriocin [Salinivirgaceae bacterium]
METLKSCKFQELSSEEMNCISGGYWGWNYIGTLGYGLCEDGSYTTRSIWEYENIWGNRTGETREVISCDQ